MTKKEYSGESLEAALKEGSLSDGLETSLTGMVKQSNQAKNISFTQSGCEHWVDIPVEMIESAEQLGSNPCRDHSHPIMKITLKSSDNPAHNVLLALLSQNTASKLPHAAGVGTTHSPFPTSTAFPSSENHIYSRQFPLSSYAARNPSAVGPGSLDPGYGFFRCTAKNCVPDCRKVDLPFGRYIWWCDLWCDVECTIGF